MLKFILRRVLQTIPVILAVITITFFMVRMAPGGPFDQEKAVPAEVLAQLNARYHLNDPLWKQFGDYLYHLVQFDFGPSFKNPSRSVTELILNGLPITFELGAYAILFALVVGVFSGVIASLKPNTLLDYAPTSLSLVGICVPSFVLGPILMLVFGLWLGIVPTTGWDTWDAKILPSIALGASTAAYISRMTRNGMLQILNQDYIRTARAKGVPERTILFRHALRGGILPVVSFLGPAFAGLLSGSFVTETIFQIPGLGRFYVQAAFNRDYTMILGTTILVSALVIIFNLLSDIALIMLNPKLSFDEAKG